MTGGSLPQTAEFAFFNDNGSTRSGYSRYGAWYGNPYGEWNTMFTYFCMYYAGVDKAEVPYGSGVWSWYEKLAGMDMLSPCGEESEGDILFFDTDADGEPDRTGIVSRAEETEAGVTLSVIEGNCAGAVAEQQYLRGTESIVAVLSVDNYVTAETAPEPETETVAFAGDTESGIHVEAVADPGVFPEGTVMLAADVADETAMQAAADTLGEDAEIRDAVAVDISFRSAEGEDLEPAEGQTVSVRILLPAEKQLSGDVCSLLHIGDNGEGTVVEEASVTPEGAEFEAESFSVYIVTGSESYKGDYTSYPTLFLRIGETVKLTAEVPAGSDDFFKVWYNDPQKLEPSVYHAQSLQAAIDSGRYVITRHDDGSATHTVTFTATALGSEDRDGNHL